MRDAHIHITGIVQGVGMRPFVYREAVDECARILLSLLGEDVRDVLYAEGAATEEAASSRVEKDSFARPAARKVTGCGECRSTCQSACKTSCTVGNQSCERITREADPEKIGK